MTAVTYPTIRRQRNRLRSIGAVLFLAIATIVSTERPTFVARAVDVASHASAAVVRSHVATPSELYATVVAP